ncbi:hypothetical protein MLD38_008826 [Melastoma candidum]|uniref:Uncharacterized protein n=1 Tax=Melastoma candidum TaxID=119954 RepID=A0ACB9RVA7_9MYRT|nr:hypothetical protein MLD38_008826 [Melastoma candidum]
MATATSNAQPNPQQTQQFLSTVLSQRGPNSLPYAEDTKWLIRHHLLSLLSAFPSLSPSVSSFTHNDGRSLPLLQAHGTIPMPFQGLTYNLPLSIWLLESYPRHPPLVYLNPTRDMIIKRPHPHVTPSGLVSLPYLQNWVYPSSNLVDLARNLSSTFSRDPPLYSQRRPSSPPIPNPNPSPSPNSTPVSSNSGRNDSFSYHGPRPAIPPRAYPPSPYSHAGSGSGSAVGRVTEDPAEVFKRNAVGKVVEAVHGDVAAMRKAREAEMEGLLGVQGVLKMREEELGRGVSEMVGEKEGLEQMLQVVLMNCDVLDSWLRDNEAKAAASKRGGSRGDAKLDESFECADGLSKQMMECTALDLAIEDTIYSLDKAAQEGVVPFDQYLRSVRLLSREQFFHRATGIKVRAVQMQAQVAHMAARVQQHYVS